ncbi:MAG: sensor histidine kinase [Limisphaerales bacterium]
MWTAFVALAAWWLLRTHHGPSVFVVHEGEALQPALADRFHGWFKVDLGLQRLYPWLLFGPYAALVVFLFPLERGRLRLRVPLNLAMCGAFAIACHVINSHTALTGATVVVFSSRHSPDVARNGESTNAVRVQMTRTGGDILVRQELSSNMGFGRVGQGGTGPIDGGWQQELLKAGMTNTVEQLRADFGSPPNPPKLPALALWPALMDLLAYGAIAGLAHSVHFYRRFREREHRALFLESNLAQARLGALRAQLQPHFLFNSLNAIATLLRRDPRLAEATLLSLSELLRLALSQSERQEVSLREELRFVQHYLEIQQTRFGDKLRVEQDVDPAALDCAVPALLLQPVVENAIRHGIEPAEKAGLVRLTGRRRNGRLVLTVEDDGVGLSAPAIDVAASTAVEAAADVNLPMLRPEARPDALARQKPGTGIGLANLRARLETLYGADQCLELSSRPEGGVVVRIELPWRPATHA